MKLSVLTLAILAAVSSSAFAVTFRNKTDVQLHLFLVKDTGAKLTINIFRKGIRALLTPAEDISINNIEAGKFICLLNGRKPHVKRASWQVTLATDDILEISKNGADLSVVQISSSGTQTNLTPSTLTLPFGPHNTTTAIADQAQTIEPAATPTPTTPAPVAQK